ncbi:MAG: type II toxin-antitoxin system RelE/ParE family toxin, partial [Mesorhizobium sp.]
MEYRIVFHPKAEAELEQLYGDIAGRASPAIAWRFIAGNPDHCLGLSTFPQRS